ncbi:MAG: lytic transglycosylase domain-containing protein [Terracidiphilus sp.]
MRGALLRTAAMMLALAMAAAAARAAERVTLRNGFQIQCDHHAAVEGRLRLYLSAGEDNYIEFPADEIAGIETVAHPPAPPPEPAHAVSAPAGADRKLSAADLGEMLGRAGRAHDLDVDLLASLVDAESGGNSRAISPAGARGLMQLMPATARRMGVENSYQPEENVQGGSAYLDALLNRYHNNLALALAAYNAGPGAVERYGGIPPYRETRIYVARVIHEFNRRVIEREARAKQAAGAHRQAASLAPATRQDPAGSR